VRTLDVHDNDKVSPVNNITQEVDLEPLKKQIITDMEKKIEESNAKLVMAVDNKLEETDKDIVQVKKVLGFMLDSGFENEGLDMRK